MNNQAPEKRTTMFANGHGKVDVHSIFYTIQGEGPFCGTPAVFVRLAGCNLQCPRCDTEYTSGRSWMEADDICSEVQRAVLWHHYPDANDISRHSTPRPLFNGLVVITGGEPFRQEIELLVLKLQQRFRCYVQVETNGTLAPPELSSMNTNIDERKGLYIVCSPKTGRVHPKTAAVACCYKYVMSADSVDPTDGLPVHALDHTLGTLRVARPPDGYSKPVYIQPMDSGNLRDNARHMQACVQSSMRHGYILQLQVHKILKME